ncbi:hypothetical protein BH23ACT5_BH23ACT5_04350 [soil metagenome]
MVVYRQRMRIAVGTEKGGYLVDVGSGAVTGPLFPGWKVTAFGRAPDGGHLAGVGSNWFGASIYQSPNMVDWAPVEASPTYGETRALSQIWTFHNVGDRVYAGVSEAGIFVSDDSGQTWTGVDSFNEHRTRDQWMPGAGGLCAHRFLSAADRLWVAVSAVGLFRSDDGGATWNLKDEGVGATGVPEDTPRPEVGYCVHNVDHDPGQPDTMWRQDHVGVFRSSNGGDSWERIENGLPAGFGFVMRRDHSSARLFVVPLHSDENRVPVDRIFRAYVSHDDGDSWEVAGTGWDDAPSFTSVLRGAVDTADDGALAFGTTGGQVWLTRDAGENWRCLDPVFPRIGAISFL